MKWLGKLLNAAPAPAQPAPTPAKPVEPIPETGLAAILRGADKARVLALLEQEQDEAHLARAAIEARLAEVRLAAAQRLETGELLEQVARESRDKDKRVYRHCADTLKQRRKIEAGARRAEEIGASLSALLEHTPLPPAPLLEIRKQLAALSDAGAAGEAAQALLERAFARQREEAEGRRDMQAAHAGAAHLAAETATAAWPWEDRLAPWRERSAVLALAREQCPAWLAHEAAALAVVLERIERQLEELERDVERQAACTAFLDAQEGAETPDAAAWSALDKPNHADLKQDLLHRWRDISARAAPPPPAPAPEPAAAPAPVARPRLDKEALGGLLDRLEQAIEEGHPAVAEEVNKELKAFLGHEHPHGALEARLHHLHARLDELRGWARWGTVQARDKLIEAAQALLTGEHEVEALAAAIADLREQWKALNPHGPASRGQWDKFDKTLETAYLPVAAWRAQQAARQAEARAAREAKLAEWEGELAGIVWDSADFKAVEAKRVEWLRLWRELPHASFRDERALRNRFDPLVHTLDQHLAAARKAETQRREAIIAEAVALSQQTDPRRAVATVKALQQRWNQADAPVRLQRGDEQKLWSRFRAACDAVFARLDQQKAEHEAKRREQDNARGALYQELAASLEGADAGVIQDALARVRAVVEAQHKPDREGREWLEKAQQRLAELRGGKQRARLDALARKAELALKVETAALAGEPLDELLAATRQTWDALPKAGPQAEKLLARRLAEAAHITRERLQAGVKARAEQALDLEILLDLPTPASWAEARRARQLARLQQHFGGGEESVSPEDLLARCHATPAPADAELERRLAAVAGRIAAGMTRH